MAGDKYLISDQNSRYFLTLTVVEWIDIFNRIDYRDIIVDSLIYCIKKKGLSLIAWVIMSNHIHLVGSCEIPYRISDFLRDFKKHTSKQIIKTICEIPESRREWLLDKFAFVAKKSGRAKDYKVWKDDNHAVDLDNNNIDINEKINYIHENPVRAGIVRNPEDYIYCSAYDYAENKRGLFDVTII